MQGFNMGRYRPYDIDPSKESFNKRSGTHALGKRARKLDQGVLIVRFELPFNIWCGGCDGHIGQGVRYNAEKSRVGEYFSTPIFRFRCKTACCQHWFEIETDPKNARYVIVSGAKEQNKEWDPAEYGGHAIQDDGTGGPSSLGGEGKEEQDPFSALEKSNADKARAASQKSRIEELEAAVSARSVDPYTINWKLRAQFRQDKRERLHVEAQDEALRKRIGWNADRRLVAADEDADTPHRTTSTKAKEAWNEARDEQAGVGRLASAQAGKNILRKSSAQARRTPTRTPKTLSSSARPASHVQPSSHARARSASALASRIIATTRAKMDPFAMQKG